MHWCSFKSYHFYGDDTAARYGAANWNHDQMEAKKGFFPLSLSLDLVKADAKRLTVGDGVSTYASIAHTVLFDNNS